MTLTEIDIVSVWSLLGGGPTRRNRGKAFWRGGDGDNIAIDAAKGTWFDFREGKGGGVLGLVETALGCSRSDALGWLETQCGLNSRRQLSREERIEHLKRVFERTESDAWGIAAKALAQQALDEMVSDDPAREGYTRLLSIIRRGGQGLAKEYRAWRVSNPELAHAMVRAGRSSDARSQRRLALYLMELANAA